MKNDSACTTFARSIRAVLCLCFLISANVHAEPTVTFLSPKGFDDSFWGPKMRLMRHMAEDLELDLELVISRENNLIIKRDALKIIERENPPDYLISAYWMGATDDVIPAADKRGIKLFLINTDIPESDRDAVGRPRTQYENWIGHMVPDDEHAGRYLTELLLSRAGELGMGTMKLVGLKGHTFTSASILRAKGMEAVVNETENAELMDARSAEWDREKARQATREMLKDHPGANVIWSASDDMALGALEAVKTMNKIPNRDIVSGGIDWTDKALQSLAAGEMTVSLGGHFIEGAMALVLIYDYHHGIDFDENPGTEIQTSLHALTPDNVGDYLKYMNTENLEKVDFKQFSKKHNPEQETYDFSMRRVLDSVKAVAP